MINVLGGTKQVNEKFHGKASTAHAYNPSYSEGRDQEDRWKQSKQIVCKIPSQEIPNIKNRLAE
jgi:hypothetical protein